jgi:DnaK suppressor protein
VATKTKARTQLDRRTVGTLRGLLEARRAALVRSIRTTIERVPASDPNRQSEDGAQAVETLLREMDIALMDRQSQQLDQIEAALERLGRQEYGFCRDCGAFIGMARLEALPFALRCRPCQDRLE